MTINAILPALLFAASVAGVAAVRAGAPAEAPAVFFTAALDAKAPQKFLSPARRDGINDAAVFGAGAAAVRVYDSRGHIVFRASRQAGMPIVWDGRDGSGRVRESGVYIARIERSDAGVQYQSFVIVK